MINISKINSKIGLLRLVILLFLILNIFRQSLMKLVAILVLSSALISGHFFWDLFGFVHGLFGIGAQHFSFQKHLAGFRLYAAGLAIFPQARLFGLNKSKAHQNFAKNSQRLLSKKALKKQKFIAVQLNLSRLIQAISVWTLYGLRKPEHGLCSVAFAFCLS